MEKKRKELRDAICHIARSNFPGASLSFMKKSLKNAGYIEEIIDSEIAYMVSENFLWIGIDQRICIR